MPQVTETRWSLRDQLGYSYLHPRLDVPKRFLILHHRVCRQWCTRQLTAMISRLRTSNFSHIHRSTESWSLWCELRVSSVTSPDRLPRPRSASPVRLRCRCCCCTVDLRAGTDASVMMVVMVVREGSDLLTPVLTGMDAGGEHWLSRNHAYCPRWQRETFHCLLSAPMRIFSGERAKSRD